MPVPPSAEQALREWADGPDRLEEALAGLTEADLDRTPPGGEWSIRQIVHRLADAEAMWMTHMKIAIICPGARIGYRWHPGNKGIANALKYAERLIEPALALFRANRRHIAQMLEIMPDAWGRYIVQVELPDWADEEEDEPQVTVETYISGLARHIREHIAEINAIRPWITSQGCQHQPPGRTGV